MMRTKKAGDRVWWRSNSRGTPKAYVGQVIAVIPSEESVRSALRAAGEIDAAHAWPLKSDVSRSDRYLVRVVEVTATREGTRERIRFLSPTCAKIDGKG